MNVIGEWVALHSDKIYTFVLEVPDLNPCQNIYCPDYNLSWFSSFPSDKMSEESKISHRQFPSESLHFIVHPVI